MWASQSSFASQAMGWQNNPSVFGDDANQCTLRIIIPYAANAERDHGLWHLHVRFLGGFISNKNNEAILQILDHVQSILYITVWSG